MKRDLGRIRELLLAVEASEKPYFNLNQTCPDSFDRYQIELLDEAGLISVELFTFKDAQHSSDLEQEVGYPSTGNPYQDTGFRVTWAGHAYIDAVRDDDIWAKTKTAVAETGGNASLEIVRELAKGFLKKKISDHTGIEW
ncbi:MAG: DUF2513 domain-containing protein [Sulfitobacter sp.]